MIFAPILHNLTPDDAGYKEVMEYNKLIGSKPKGGFPLADKIERTRLWEKDCLAALKKVQEV